MKYLFLLLAVLGLSRPGSCCQAIGYITDKITIWRFWEIENNRPVAKMLVLNVTDSALTFYLRRTNLLERNEPLRKMLLRHNHLVDTVVVPQEVILPHTYRVYNLGSQGNCDDVAYVNDKFIGMETKLGTLTLTEYKHRYYSYQGTWATIRCLIGQDNLFATRGKYKELDLYFNCVADTFSGGTYRVEVAQQKGVEQLSFCFDDGSCMKCVADNKVAFTVGCSGAELASVHVKFKVAKGSDKVDLALRRIFDNGNSMGVGLPVIVQ